MLLRSVIDYEAMNGWSALAAAVGTVAAVAVALWQAGKARKEGIAQQRYRNWLEQKRLEEEHLSRMLATLSSAFRAATDFYFSGHRLLAGIPVNIAPSPQEHRDVQAFLDAHARRIADAEATVSSYINVLGALRELHRHRNETETAEQYDQLLGAAIEALDAVGVLNEWLSDAATIRSTAPDKFDELPNVTKAREATHNAERAIARRLVSLYEAAPAG